MEKLDWIKELVLAEQQMEESGMVDFSAGDRSVLKGQSRPSESLIWGARLSSSNQVLLHPEKASKALRVVSEAIKILQVPESAVNQL